MALVREPGSEILTQFIAPTRGTWRNTAINTVPLDAVYDSLNIFVREGKLRNRPGLEVFDDAFAPNAAADRHILGGSMSVTPTGKLVYAVSTNRLHIYNDILNTWQGFGHDTGQPFANSTIETVDIAFMETSSEYVALFANNSYAMKRYRIGNVTGHPVPGTNIPFAASICISASRVIAFTPPHTITWSHTLDYTIFDSLAIVKRSQTTDRGICVRSLSALSFVLYKETSIHLARAQAGLSEATAFAFSEPIIAEGPAGVYSVVDVNGTHIYMTKSGRIAIFDGVNYPRWIADGIWFHLQEDINQIYAHLIRGVYDYRLNTVVFFYPRASETSIMTGMVIINLPFPGFEAQEGLEPYCFLGISSRGITHACTKRFDTEINKAFIFTEPEALGTPQNYTLDEETGSDGGIVFNCAFQTGLQAAPDARHIQTTTESFLERGAGYGNINITPVTSDTLETSGGTIHIGDTQQINLESAPVNEYIGFNKKTRFFGFKYTWLSTDKVRYSGTVVYDSVKRRK